MTVNVRVEVQVADGQRIPPGTYPDLPPETVAKLPPWTYQTQDVPAPPADRQMRPGRREVRR